MRGVGRLMIDVFYLRSVLALRIFLGGTSMFGRRKTEGTRDVTFSFTCSEEFASNLVIRFLPFALGALFGSLGTAGIQARTPRPDLLNQNAQRTEAVCLSQTLPN